jgi:hypothetical protein
MHTLFDFISDVNTVQYGLALLFVLGYIIFSEILKPRPFGGLIKSVTEDVAFVRNDGKGMAGRLVKNLALAPVYMAVYLVAVPLLLVQGIATPLGKGISSVTSAGWSPVRAYFKGRAKGKKSGQDSSKKRASD